jgi:N-6 DNA methylase
LRQPACRITVNAPNNHRQSIRAKRNAAIRLHSRFKIPTKGVAVPGNANLLIGGVKAGTNGNGVPKLSTKDWKTLQEKTFFGKEKKSLAYVIGIMNMILHGIHEAFNGRP